MNTGLLALLQVLLIDITLAGDNAVVVGLAVAGLPSALRARAIWAGIGAAALIRVALSLVAVRLLAVLGLTLAGGLLLLWVCLKMFRELRAHHGEGQSGPERRKTLFQAIRQIVIADLSMSLDNVLAVAGAAREHVWIMVGGLGLSVVLMALAANLLARLLDRYRWIAWLGLAVVVYVAAGMIVHGWHEVAGHVLPSVAVTGSWLGTQAQAFRHVLSADATSGFDAMLASIGVAREHAWIIVGELALLVAVIAVAAGMLAAALGRHGWVVWLGLAVVICMAGKTAVYGWHGVSGDVRHILASMRARFSL